MTELARINLPDGVLVIGSADGDRTTADEAVGTIFRGPTGNEWVKIAAGTATTDWLLVRSGGAGHGYETGLIAGERNPDSATAGYQVTLPEVNYTVVDLSTNSTTVSAAPAMLTGIYVDTALSAQACPIKDDTTTVFSLPASTPVGAFDFGNQGSAVKFATSLVVDPDDAATGTVVVFWKAV